MVNASLGAVARHRGRRTAEHPLPLFRAALPSDVRLFVAGKIWTRDEAERVVSLGADVVALGRSAIANPEWPQQIADAAWEPTRPPLSVDELASRGLSPLFANYMKRWKNFVRE